jgi:hypothetical protein
LQVDKEGPAEHFMMAAYQIEVATDGNVQWAGSGDDLDRLEAVVKWHARKSSAATEILVGEDPTRQSECFRVEVRPADGPAAVEFVCCLDYEFRESGSFHCIRRWVRGQSWGWLVRHLPEHAWLHPRPLGTPPSAQCIPCAKPDR